MSTDLSFDWHVEAMISDNDGRVRDWMFDLMRSISATTS